MPVLHIGALLLALGLTPWLAARIIAPRSVLPTTLALWGPALIALNSLIPLLLHLSGLSITATSLAAGHGIAALTAVVLAAVRHQSWLPGRPPHIPPLLSASVLLLVILFVPFTPIAGIDTYKWQDLAGNVAVEGRIAWLVHPLSLFGFTPRSYPSAQPLLLATVQLMGHAGVDWGFYIVSVVVGLTGLFGAWRLGLLLFPSSRLAAWFAFLYCFSPVFMRYSYWATGRGVLLALLPVFLLAWLKFYGAFRHASRHPGAALRALAAVLILSVLLALAHKAGTIGVMLVPALLIPSLALAGDRSRIIPLLMLGAAALIGLALSGCSPAAWLYRPVTRFGWLLPLTVLAMTASPHCVQSGTLRGLRLAAAATLALSCLPDMYGALLALPFITLLAVSAIPAVNALLLNLTPNVRLGPWLAGATLLTAIVILANQAQDSPSRELVRVAGFIERLDPTGPFRIEAPGKARMQIQAYVSGCPRFSVDPAGAATAKLHPPPGFDGSLAQVARVWIDYLRGLFDMEGLSTAWYGKTVKTYAVTVNGEGHVPPGSLLLYTDGNVELYTAPIHE